MKILLNLIGGQPAPIYIATRLIDPDLNIMIYSKDSEKQNQKLMETLPGYNYEAFLVNPYDYDDCVGVLKEVTKKYIGSELILNPTSGTKIMSFAGFKLFSDLKKDILYIDSQNHKSIFFKKGMTPIIDKINLSFPIKDYFSIYGYLIETGDPRFPDNETYYKIRKFMHENYFQFKYLISKINIQIYNKVSIIDCNDDTGNLYFTYNIEEEKGLFRIKRGRKETSLEINKKNEFDYLLGYWMEDFVFYKFSELKLFDELLMNVKIYTVRDNLQPEYQNEFDICGIKDQTVYIFECKTGNLDKGIVEKLRLIKNLTGTYSKINLITLFRPVESAAKERIKDFKIKHINLNELEEFINEFKNQKDTNPNL
ncbi:MAG TPA: DUF1887 family CARF protein [Ignavibacteria bacterium]|nr:DUF1887 family CARF protein [Ignavibacteria bacterium]HMR40311.1 DUF1887 family CARF protein [Ignavibacteria bacterium]